MTIHQKTRSYKREFIDKVKQKFNDVQSSNKVFEKPVRITQDDKKCKKCNS